MIIFNSRFQVFKKIICNPGFCCIYFVERYGKYLPDKLYLQLIYRLHMGKSLNLNCPKTFNEKLQWLKLNDRNINYTTMVDKLAVKKYVSDKIGSKYVVRLIESWDSVEQIEWEKLPSQFVLKTTHDGGGSSVVLCRDYSKFNRKFAIDKLKVSMKHEIYSRYREWPYKNVPHKIIAEEYLEDELNVGTLMDYKVMCFNGKPKLIQVHKGRFKEHTQDFYDLNWNLLPITQGLPMSKEPIKRPVVLEEMLRLSSILSEGIPFLRVDWYIVQNRLYFGEMTFFDASGFDDFDQDKYNYLLGDWIVLPNK